jgi:heparan-alpha-glucosaminide N-acetyltransferase
MPTDSLSPSASQNERIVSIDAFRGLTMLVMLFVNDIGDYGVKNAPYWLYHMSDVWKTLYKGRVDGMTLPDVIYPAFLFIVGLSIPIALERRIAKGDSFWKLSWHIVSRAMELIFLGLCIVNMNHINEQATGMSRSVWQLLLFLGAILFWNRYPKCKGIKHSLFEGMRTIGAFLMIYLVMIFRQGEGDQIVWMQPHWWGILGCIGWAYLVAAFVWLLCRNFGAAVMGAFALLVAMRIGREMHFFEWWQTMLDFVHIPKGWLMNPGSISGEAALVVAGMTIATFFRPNAPTQTPRSRIVWMLLFAAAFAYAAYLLRPMEEMGLSKNQSTPAWILYCAALSTTIYAFLYWLVDVMKIKRWTVLVAPAGSNTLLMYLLPYMLYSSLALWRVHLQDCCNQGLVGVSRAAVLAIGLVGVTGLLTRCGVRLQL